MPANLCVGIRDFRAEHLALAGIGWRCARRPLGLYAGQDGLTRRACDCSSKSAPDCHLPGLISTGFEG